MNLNIRTCLVSALFLFALQLFSNNTDKYKFLVEFKYKNQSVYTLDKPKDYLSQKSIQRRMNQGIKVDSTDLPINQRYIDAVIAKGGTYVTKSKWLNTVTVSSNDIHFESKLNDLSFVEDVTLTWRNDLPVLSAPRLSPKNNNDAKAEVDRLLQLKIHDLLGMHQKGFKGQGMLIAVIDAGFKNANAMTSLKHAFNSNRIVQSLDVVNPNSDIYNEHYHGAMVLTCMAANEKDSLLGTAPEADYVLIRTEDVHSEFPVEMDYWIAGAEYADSLGADLINSSLGYSEFDDTTMNFTFADLNGVNARISEGAQLAVEKGIIVVNSAGNSGNKAWRYITSPADALDVIAVGSINRDSTYTVFSSIGFTPDQRVKPDVMALGSQTWVQGTSNNYGFGYGTSYASPVMCGAIACLWQALPDLSAKQIIERVRKYSDRYDSPDPKFGYGIPNIYQAYLDPMKNNIPFVTEDERLFAFPNPTRGNIIIKVDDKDYVFTIYLLNGKKVFISSGGGILENNVKINIQNLPKGMLIAELKTESGTITQKLIHY